jgi:hypothetical protein
MGYVMNGKEEMIRRRGTWIRGPRFKLNEKLKYVWEWGREDKLVKGGHTFN